MACVIFPKPDCHLRGPLPGLITGVSTSILLSAAIYSRLDQAQQPTALKHHSEMLIEKTRRADTGDQELSMIGRFKTYETHSRGHCRAVARRARNAGVTF
jgi:hypothetical protein